MAVVVRPYCDRSSPARRGISPVRAPTTTLAISGCSNTQRTAAYAGLRPRWRAPLGEMRHDIGRDQFVGLGVVPVITVDQQLHTGVLVLADQIDPLGHDADKAPQGPAASQPLTLRRHRGLVAGEQQAVVVRLFNGILIALRCIALTAKHRELVPHCLPTSTDFMATSRCTH